MIECLNTESDAQCLDRCQNKKCVDACPITTGKVCGNDLVVYVNNCDMSCANKTLVTACL